MTPESTFISKRAALAAETPQYLPAISTLLRMARVDQTVLADDLQFRHPSSVNRAAIKTADGRQWLTVPVITDSSSRIADVRIDNSVNWRRKHWRTLQVNYSWAPYFEYFDDFFEGIYRREWTFLVDLNLAIVEHLCQALRINVPQLRTSQMDLPGEVCAKTLALLRTTGSSVYVTHPATMRFLNKAGFGHSAIEMQAISGPDFVYRQQFGEFLQDLSVVDLLFNEGPEAMWLLSI